MRGKDITMRGEGHYYEREGHYCEREGIHIMKGHYITSTEGTLLQRGGGGGGGGGAFLISAHTWSTCTLIAFIKSYLQMSLTHVNFATLWSSISMRWT